MKKLCFITYQFKIGGVESLFISLAKELTKYYEIYLIPLNQNYDEELISQIDTKVNIIKFNKRPSDKTRKNLIINTISYINKIIKIKKNKRLKGAEFINFSDTISTLLVAFICSSRGKFSSWVQLNPLMLKNSKFFNLYKFCYSKAKNIICICQDQTVLMKELFPGIDNNNIKVVYNCLDFTKISTKANCIFNKEFKYILAVGRIDNRSKDFKTLIKAYEKWKNKYQREHKLIIIGDGPNFKELEEITNISQYKSQIILLGRENNPYKWMKNAELFIHSSKFEGFGLVILEALALSIPVIATDCKVGPREILNNGKCGILVKVTDENEMSEAIEYILNNKEKYTKEINKHITQFSREEAIKKILKIF